MKERGRNKEIIKERERDKAKNEKLLFSFNFENSKSKIHLVFDEPSITFEWA